MDQEVLTDFWDQLVSQESEDNLDQSELLELQVRTETWDELEVPEIREPEDHRENVE